MLSGAEDSQCQANRINLAIQKGNQNPSAPSGHDGTEWCRTTRGSPGGYATSFAVACPHKTPGPWVLGGSIIRSWQRLHLWMISPSRQLVWHSDALQLKRWSLFHCTVGWGLKRTLPASWWSPLASNWEEFGNFRPQQAKSRFYRLKTRLTICLCDDISFP